MAGYTDAIGGAAPVKLRKKSQAWDITKRVFRYPSAKVGGVIFAIIVLLAVLAPVIAPYGPLEMRLDQIFMRPCAEHWFGTDGMGRDILSRILHGAKYSLALGLICSFAGNALGVILGSIAGSSP